MPQLKHDGNALLAAIPVQNFVAPGWTVRQLFIAGSIGLGHSKIIMTDYTYEILKLLHDNDGSMDVSLVIDNFIKDKEQIEVGKIKKKVALEIMTMWEAEKKFIKQIPVSLGAEFSNRYFNQSQRHIDDEVSIDIEITPEGFNEYRRLDAIHNPIPEQPKIDRSMHFYDKATGTFSTGENASQTYNENPTPEKEKWWITARNFILKEFAKWGVKEYVFSGILILILGYLGLAPSTDKKLEKPTTIQQDMQKNVPTDTTGRKDSVVQ